MDDIIRCPACRTLVYASAARCHGCDAVLGRRRIVTKGTWAFVVVATAIFSVFAGADLLQDRRRREYEQAAEVRRTYATQEVVEAWIRGDNSAMRNRIDPGEANLMTRLRTLREAYPTVFPGNVEDWGRTRKRRVRMERMGAQPPIAREAVFDLAPPKPSIVGQARATRAARRVAEAGADVVDGVEGPTACVETCTEAYAERFPSSAWFSGSYGREAPNVVRTWSDEAYEYEAFVRKDDRRFRVFVAAHIDDDDLTLRGIRVGRIEDEATGEVISAQAP